MLPTWHCSHKTWTATSSKSLTLFHWNSTLHPLSSCVTCIMIPTLEVGYNKALLLLLADLDLPEWFRTKALDGLEPLHHKAHGWKLAAVESENCCHKLVTIVVTIEFCQLNLQEAYNCCHSPQASITWK